MAALMNSGSVQPIDAMAYDTQAWLQDRGGWVLGMLLALAVGATAIVTLARRRSGVVR